MFKTFKNRVSYPLYFSTFIIGIAVLTWYWLRTSDPIIWLISFVLMIPLNHIMLVDGLSSLVNYHKVKPNALKMLALLFGKTILLGLAVLCIVRYAPHNIYSTLILYIFQLIILIISIKKDTQNN